MKKTLIILTFLFILPALMQQGFSQEKFELKNIEPDSRMVDALGKNFVERIQVENPMLVLYYNYFLDNSFYITEYPEGKSEFVNSVKSLPILPETTLEEINVLKFKLNLKYDEQSYFRLSESNKIMVFYSGEELNKNYNEYRRTLGLLTETETKK